MDTYTDRQAHNCIRRVHGKRSHLANHDSVHINRINMKPSERVFTLYYKTHCEFDCDKTLNLKSQQLPK